ncbi:transposase [Candidatus Woesearchaeota archaeon]|nr:transposase [Candidatus Woesearchaeota archaeon]
MISKKSSERWRRGIRGVKQLELGDFMPFKIEQHRYDMYANLNKIANKYYKEVEAAPQRQIIPENYQFKPYGEKRTYPQDWRLYYLACRTQKEMFLHILKDSVDYLVIEQDYCGNGRPPVNFADVIKSLVIKSYNGLSSWGTETELNYAKSLGIIDNVYRKTSINKYMNSKRTVNTLHELYKIIALPIESIESEYGQYALDATGISNAYKNKKWVDVRLEKKKHKTFTKLHILCGTRTNAIISARITDGTKHDSIYLKELIKDASKRFRLKEVSADKAYTSRKNCDIIGFAGARPFLMPKKNSKAWNRGDSCGYWGDMIRMWKNSQLLFGLGYHRRSIVESLFSALKREWGDYCRCKLQNTIETEILSKIVCYNIKILSFALLSNDIQPVFMST